MDGMTGPGLLLPYVAIAMYVSSVSDVPDIFCNCLNVMLQK
jgi:hypothetical protein